MDAPEAWANVAADGAPGGKGVIVAVLDTGVAYANRGPFRRSPDFARYEFVKGYDFVATTPTPTTATATAPSWPATIAEATDNRYGLTGLAYGARIMPVRVLDTEGEGEASTIAEGVRFAVNHGAQVINLSLEFSPGVTASDIPELIDALRYAHRRGVLVVAAAGNEGHTAIAYPARAPDVVAVGATTEHGCLADYSNDGSGLTLVAPGGGADANLPGDPNCHPEQPPGRDIYQVTFTGSSPRRFGLPVGYEGTSMAAPHVAATAALIIASGVLGRHPTPGPDHRAAARHRAQAGRRRRRTPVRGGPGGRRRGHRSRRPGRGRGDSLRRRADPPEPPDPRRRERCDCAVVGGGIVGLAVARELIRRNPRASVCVLEREREVGTHQTGHNSGVIHAGIYYAPGSLKARLCVEGARELYEYCAERGIAHERCGKVIVATDSSELAPAGGARAPGQGQRGARPAPHRRRAASHELEPHARGIAGLHSPGTGIVDFRAVARSYADECSTRAARSRPAARSKTCEIRSARCVSCTRAATTEAGHAIFCAGAWADRLAVAAGADPDPRIVPFRGAYLRLVPERRQLVRSLIYPVPDPVAAVSRRPPDQAHRRRGADRADRADRGRARRLPPRGGAAQGRARHARLARHVADARAAGGAPGVSELRHAALRSAFVRAAARYVPELRRRTSSPPSPACAPRRSAATAGWSTTSSSPPPSGPCTCATRPRPPPPPRWRSPATSPRRPSTAFALEA